MNTWYSGNKKGQRYDGLFTGRLNSVKKPSEKLLYVCEEEQSLDDGNFNPNPNEWYGGSTGRVNAVASRHQAKRATAKSVAISNARNQDAKGNVVFFDGHAEFFTRKDALRQRYTGNPTPDPANF
jgi:prepilin-type processing-associated H-X9-DG protein